MGLMLIAGTILLLSGCGTVSTVTPDIEMHDRIAPPDSTAPQPYEGWLLYSLWDDQGRRTHAIISTQAADRYCALVDDYQLQYYARYKERVSHSDLTSYITVDGHEAFKMDAQHFEAFIRLSRWNKAHRETDSMWMKIKDTLTL